MVVSNNSENRQKIKVWQALVGQLSRYDFVLAVIPLVFALSLVVYALSSVPLHTSVGVAALVSGLFVADALYLNPPTESSMR